jgi:hypothetical protein
MYETAEMRWFGPGPPPAQLRAWFGRAGRAPEREPVRRDYYLRTGTGALGVKLRERRLECKRRLPLACGVEPAVPGAVQAWGKWSLALEAGGAAVEEIVRPAQLWRTVVKRRLRRRLCALASTAEEVEPARPVADGCDLELTAIELPDVVAGAAAAGGGSWWSLGLEAFGTERAPLDVLQRCAPFALAGMPLADDHPSLSYPEWLLGLGE